MPIPTRQDDLDLLRILDLRDCEGFTSPEISEATGRTRSAIMGSLKRTDHAQLPCFCKKPENQDGGMKRGWWR